MGIARRRIDVLIILASLNSSLELHNTGNNMKQTHSVLRSQDEKQQRLLRSVLQSCYFLFLCTDLEPCTLVGILSMRFASQSLMKYPSARKMALCFVEEC